MELSSSSLSPRRPTRRITLGGVAIGDGAPITVQSMTTTKTADVDGTLAQVYALAAAGADIVRCTCNEAAAAEGLAHIVPRSPVPIVADIHFHHEMALAALEAGVQGLRLNPGNLRKEAEIKQVAAEARDRGVPIRIGVNAGSLHPDLYKKHGGATPEALVESAQHELALFEEVGFSDVKISVKASSVPLMIAAYRLACGDLRPPLASRGHRGRTAAGRSGEGHRRHRHPVGRGHRRHHPVLAHGRSGRGGPAGRQLFEALGLRERKGLDLIACPSCGRAQVDVIAVAKEAQEALEQWNLPIQVAVMGCVVNGPGEAAGGGPRHRRGQAEGPPVHPGQDRPGRTRGRDGAVSRRGGRALGGRRASRRASPPPTRAPRRRRRPTAGRCSEASTPTTATSVLTGSAVHGGERDAPNPHIGQDRAHQAPRRPLPSHP